MRITWNRTLGSGPSSEPTMSATGCIMRAPPRFTTARLNTLAVTVEEAKSRFSRMLDGQPFAVEQHPILKDLIVVEGRGPASLQPLDLELYVDHKCGDAVCRGAPIFIPGIVGTSDVFTAGDKASVWLDIRRKVLRGQKCGKLDGPKIFLGNGQFTVGRNQVFGNSMLLSEIPHGVGFEVTEPIWHQPRFTDGFGNWAFSQNLPSVLVGHMLSPKPGESVLDMCAAPGGKSTHIAQLMNDSGRVVCLDRGPKRTILVHRNALALGLKSIEVTSLYDARKAVGELGDSKAEPPFPPGCFDRILVDAPCSSLGQRPTLHRLKSWKEIRSSEKVQRDLLKTAVRLLKTGGTLVYSTCTMRREENEDQVAYILREEPSLRLSPSQYRFSNAPVLINGVDYAADGSCQKFDPQLYCARHPNGNCIEFLAMEEQITKESICEVFSESYSTRELTFDTDTIGFFVAKFTKI